MDTLLRLVVDAHVPSLQAQLQAHTLDKPVVHKLRAAL